MSLCAVWCALEGEEVDEQIRLRDDTIYHLKQQISTQQQRIEELNEDLRGQLLSQVPTKDEGIYVLSQYTSIH